MNRIIGLDTDSKIVLTGGGLSIDKYRDDIRNWHEHGWVIFDLNGHYLYRNVDHAASVWWPKVVFAYDWNQYFTDCPLANMCRSALTLPHCWVVTRPVEPPTKADDLEWYELNKEKIVDRWNWDTRTRCSWTMALQWVPSHCPELRLVGFDREITGDAHNTLGKETFLSDQSRNMAREFMNRISKHARITMYA